MSISDAPRFGTLLRRLRKNAGLTQAALAERAGMSERGLQDLERGVHRVPRRDTLDLLAAALGISEPDQVAFLAAAQISPQPDPVVLPMPDSAPGSVEALVPLVGRTRELVLLERFLAGEGTVVGAARVLVLAGEPGIGKTRLLQAVAQQAIARGWCVLFGGCHRRGGRNPTHRCLMRWQHTCKPPDLRTGAPPWLAAPGWCAWSRSWRRIWSRCL